MNTKQLKKTKQLIKMRFKDLVIDSQLLPFKSRLKLCFVILTKNKKILNLKTKVIK